MEEPAAKRLKLGNTLYSTLYIFKEGLITREETINNKKPCMKAVCSICAMVWWNYKKENYNTSSTYRKHFQKKHPTVRIDPATPEEQKQAAAKKQSKELLKQTNISIFTQPQQSLSSATLIYRRAPHEPFEQKVFITLLLNFIISCNLPIRTCNAPSFNNLLSYCSSEVSRVTPQKLVKALVESFDSSQNGMKQKLYTHIEDGSRVALTMDIWVSYSGTSYLTITVHWTDTLWITHARLLCFTKVPPSHTSANILRSLRRTLKQFGIHKHIIIDPLVFYFQNVREISLP